MRASYDRRSEGAPQDEEDFRELSDDEALRGQQLTGHDPDAIELTFLPEIARLCDEHGVRLVLVRHSSRADDAAQAAVRMDKLWRVAVHYLGTHYPADRVLDMTTCWGIGPEHRYAGDHFTAAARKLLSEHFAAQYIDVALKADPTNTRPDADDEPNPARKLLVPRLWKPPRSSDVKLSWQRGSLHGNVTLDPGTRVYMTHDGQSVRSKPALPELEVNADQRYVLHMAGSCDDSVSLIIFLMQFNSDEMTVSTKWRFEGDLRPSLRMQPDTVAIRLAIRIAGNGEFQLDDIRLIPLDHADQQ